MLKLGRNNYHSTKNDNSDLTFKFQHTLSLHNSKKDKKSTKDTDFKVVLFILDQIIKKLMQI